MYEDKVEFNGVELSAAEANEYVNRERGRLVAKWGEEFVRDLTRTMGRAREESYNPEKIGCIWHSNPILWEDATKADVVNAVRYAADRMERNKMHYDISAPNAFAKEELELGISEMRGFVGRWSGKI